MKQVGPIRMSDHRPMLVDCLCERDHGDNCVAAAQAWLSANHVDNMETKSDVIQVMMRLSAARNRGKAAQDRAKAANNDALQAEKEKDVAQKEVQELERELQPKRARTHAVTVDEDEECEKKTWDDWDLADHRREATLIQNLCEFFDTGDGTSCEKEFNLPHLKERTQDVDTSRAPVAMIINSNELGASGFKLNQVLPPTLEAPARTDLHTRGSGLRRLEGMAPKSFVLSVDDDTDFRSRCE